MQNKNIKIDRFIFNEIPTKKVNDKIVLDADGQNIAYLRLKKDEVEYLENKLSEITDFLTVPKIANNPFLKTNNNRRIRLVLLNYIEVNNYNIQLTSEEIISTQNHLKILLTDLNNPDEAKFVFTTKNIDNGNILGLDTDEKRYFFFIRNSPQCHDPMFLFDYLKEINSVII